MKNKKNFPSTIIGVIIIVMGLIILTSSAVYDEKVISQLLILLPSFIISMAISVLLNFLIPTQVVRVLTRMGIIFFFFYLIFYFLSKDLDEISSYFIALIFCGPILITTFMFQNRAIKREEREMLKRNWYLVDFPIHIFENGSMVLERNNNFIKKNFIEVIFVDKNFKKIDGQFDQIDFCKANPRRVKKMGKIGFIDDDTKKIIIEPQFDTASDFWGEKEPVSSVMKGNRIFLINKNGKTIPHSD
jgi:hypothetical protein